MKTLIIFLLIILFGREESVARTKSSKRKGSYSFKDKNLAFSENEMNWFAGNSYCKNVSKKMVALETQEKDLAFINLLKSKGMENKSIWLAGSRLEDEKTYRWGFGGPPLSYTHWGPHQPDNRNGIQRCMKTYIANTWDDQDCLALGYVICEMK